MLLYLDSEIESAAAEKEGCGHVRLWPSSYLGRGNVVSASSACQRSLANGESGLFSAIKEKGLGVERKGRHTDNCSGIFRGNGKWAVALLAIVLVLVAIVFGFNACREDGQSIGFNGANEDKDYAAGTSGYNVDGKRESSEAGSTDERNQSNGFDSPVAASDGEGNEMDDNSADNVVDFSKPSGSSADSGGSSSSSGSSNSGNASGGSDDDNSNSSNSDSSSEGVWTGYY